MVEMVNLLAKAWMDDPEITVPFPERIRRAGLSPHSEHLSEFALRWCAVQACLAILRLDIHSTKALRFVVEHT